MNDWWLSEPTTEGREHWYLVCIRSESQANVVGPFFDLNDAEHEVEYVKEDNTCELPHLTRRGPIPSDWLARCRRPLVFDLHNGKRDWWETWSYSPAGERRQVVTDAYKAVAAS